MWMNVWMHIPTARLQSFCIDDFEFNLMQYKTHMRVLPLKSPTFLIFSHMLILHSGIAIEIWNNILTNFISGFIIIEEVDKRYYVCLLPEFVFLSTPQRNRYGVATFFFFFLIEIKRIISNLKSRVSFVKPQLIVVFLLKLLYYLFLLLVEFY